MQHLLSFIFHSAADVVLSNIYGSNLLWLGAPSCQRGSYAFYKSVSSRPQPDGPAQVWKLGEFYFIRCGPQDPVCIAEVTLLWEDQTRRHLLASARLYFLPEDTPKGRTREHGEVGQRSRDVLLLFLHERIFPSRLLPLDEVLAVSRKMVVRVEDLVQWGCAERSGWSSYLKTPAACGINGLHKPPQSSDENVCEETTNEPLEVKIEDDPRQGITILSYPQYCRFRSLQSRILEGARGPGLQDPHLLALGGVQVLPHIRLMYCRDTFNHPTLENSAGFSWQFSCPSLSLRGRPRKRKARDGKDSPTSGQSDSWIERMKENVMGSVEVGCEGSWLPHPEEQTFLDQLFAYMERLGSPVHKVPNLGFKKIDLFKMYSVVKRLGGYKKVTVDRLWKIVYNELGGCAGSTSAATCTRRHYERLMLPYEEHLRAGGTEFKIPECPMPQKPRAIRGRKPLQRGRKPGPKSQEKKMATAAAACARTRGRGRPPGTRNKSTLIAQAKMAAQQQARIKLEAESQLLSPLLQAHPAGHPRQHAPHPGPLPHVGPLPPFQPKPKELNSDRGESAPPLLLSTLPRHFVGGSLGGVCPLDVFRNRISLQRGPESPALTPQDPPAQHHPIVYTLQPKSGSPETPTHPSREQLQPQPHLHPPHQQHNHCSGCVVDEAAPQRGVSRDVRNRPPLPPLRVLPLNLDCSDSSGLVSVPDLHPPPVRGSVPGPEQQAPLLAHHAAPEQALPLNLSKRFVVKRPSAEGPESSHGNVNGNADQPLSKRLCTETADNFGLGGRSSSGGSGGEGEQEVEMRNQEEPADLSSPSRIRAFLLSLPPFQVKFEEDLNGTRFGKFLPPGPMETQRSATETGEGGVAVKKEDEVFEMERCETERSNKQEEKDHPPLRQS
ncbi:hypothetical protein F7725_007038 [Dissostichus mawsoni]|uniref:ARID domain-containing protein n=1 Tax=Dissostichus mawsoni TaxID=36200 RepID=A0A7J5XVN0_DISMA|nr:hypothetical protein F7725_007038 [Dissostichus mawsoni]